MESPTPLICETCGRPYVVDESCDSHMNPPDDYGRGFSRYCLACWLGVGPKDCPETGYTKTEGAGGGSTQNSSGRALPENGELRNTSGA